MTAQLILAGLKICLDLLIWLRQKQALDAGRDREIARAALAVLGATEEGTALRAKIAALGDTQADALWSQMIEKP